MEPIPESLARQVDGEGRDWATFPPYEERGDVRFALACVFPILFGAFLWLMIANESYAAADATSSETASSARLAERRSMVETQLKAFGRTPVTDEQVIRAMLKVPRHLFVPEAGRAHAYDDSPVPIGHGQTISQPYIVALMTQALELTSGMKVLEVGTGSGYQAALLAEITPQVYTIEIIRPLYEQAQERLRALGYTSCAVRLGDGYYGMAESAPFDRIVVTCAALHIPPPLWEQLKAGGRMVIPIGGPYEIQRLLLVTKDEQGRRSSRTLELVRFVPLVTDAVR
jgi:protein-L-isoaspartate(D-aspartate) O-methyltransferase